MTKKYVSCAIGIVLVICCVWPYIDDRKKRSVVFFHPDRNTDLFNKLFSDGVAGGEDVGEMFAAAADPETEATGGGHCAALHS
jgi:hypothetical protein